jgi:Bacterial PH domain
MPNEIFIGEGCFHGFYTCVALCSVFFYGAAGCLVQYLYHYFFGKWPMMPAWAGLGLGAWVTFWMMMRKWTTEIILTDKRLLYKRGFFLVNVDEVDIEQLASDYVQQSLLGRLLDYGTIHIRCIEASDLWLPPIARPYEFRNAIEQQKQKYRELFMDVGRIRRHSQNEAA